MSIPSPDEVLPHRPPFLFVDEITELEPGTKAVGTWTLSGDEAFFSGHFPGRPTLPGVLMCEAIAQVGAFALLSREVGALREDVSRGGKHRLGDERDVRSGLFEGLLQPQHSRVPQPQHPRGVVADELQHLLDLLLGVPAILGERALVEEPDADSGIGRRRVSGSSGGSGSLARGAPLTPSRGVHDGEQTPGSTRCRDRGVEVVLARATQRTRGRGRGVGHGALRAGVRRDPSLVRSLGRLPRGRLERALDALEIHRRER